MTAEALIKDVVKAKHQTNARVMVFKRDVHTILKPTDTVPEEDNITDVMIHVPDLT